MEVPSRKRPRLPSSEECKPELLNGDVVSTLESEEDPTEIGIERLQHVAESAGSSGVQRPTRFAFSAKPTLEEIRQIHADFTDERDWNQYHKPRNLLLAMVGEVGEVAELFQWKGEVSEGLADWTEKEREQLAHELSDVLIYLVELAEKCHVDLPQAVLRKVELNKQKYPASKVHGLAKKYTEYTD